MQLKKPAKKNSTLRQALSLASCALLQTPLQAEPWDVQSAVMVYAEGDGRVALLEPVVKASREIADDERVTLQVAFDTLTGASPNGAQASAQAQTFTSPSGQSRYSTPAAEIPLDNTFSDTRLAVSAEWDRGLDRDQRLILGSNVSIESDYRSLGASVNYKRDLNRRNTTLAAGVALTLDSIGAEEVALPVPLSEMQFQSVIAGDESEGESRITADLLLGVTQVLDRKTLMQLNYSVSLSSGYHNDPYKIVSQVDGVSGVATGRYFYEQRPDQRLRQSLYWKAVRQLNEDVVKFSFRYYQDDWGIGSQTADLKYRFELGGGHFLQPHLRYYHQSAADFYRHSLYTGPSPTLISADYRLAEFDSQTVGLKYGQQGVNGELLSVRLELIEQRGDSSPSDAIGAQKQFDLFADTQALLLQVGYSFVW